MSGPESNQGKVSPGTRIPGVAECLQNLLATAQQRSGNLRQLADAVEKDPALLYDYLRVARPADLATWYETYDPEFARVIATTRGIDLLRGSGAAADTSRVRRLWKLSLATALLNREIAACLFSADPSLIRCQREAYLTGLLSHVGELDNNLAEQAGLVVEEESATAGTTRSAQMLTGLLGNPLLVDAVRFRDRPVELLIDAHWLVRSLAISSALVSLVVETGLAQQTDYELCEQMLGISPEQVDQCLSGATRMLHSIIEELGDPASGKEAISPDKSVQQSLALHGTIADSSALAVIANLLERSEDMTSWWRNVQLIGRLVFDFSEGFLFLLNKTGQRLVSTEVDAQQFSIALDNPRSILAQAVNSQRLSTTVEQIDLAVVDQQLISLSKARFLVCIPFHNEGLTTGVLVFGALEKNLSHLLPLEKLLEGFAELVAEHYERRLMTSALSNQSPKGIDPEYFQIRAREVTHEINNPLSVLQNYMKILSMKLGEDSSVQGDLKTISEEINRISGIVQKFSQIVSESEIGAFVLNLNEIVKDIVGVFKGSAPDARFVLQLDENVPHLDISRDAIKQVLVNLLKNALEAMSNSGNIVVTTTAGVNLGGAIYVEILISDDGPGIPGETRQLLFKEVNTSKGPAHGGLGLTIVKKLIDEMNGYISCRSSADTGTDFQILLPVSSKNNSE